MATPGRRTPTLEELGVDLRCGQRRRVVTAAEPCYCVEAVGHPLGVDHRCDCGQRWPRTATRMDQLIDWLDSSGRLGA